ncbi:unnamed protein product [Durusdinium trenchii]|uniref:Ubiquitin-like domain-containing protein n=1 Tax=Durusdinium trenchii TaxID=1381693 RepID=A0ABP0SBZ0_9DINO
MEVSFRQLNGEAMVLEVMPEMTGRELKERIKDRQLWDDELTRKTTRVDILVGPSRLLTNDETAADAGLSPESDVTVILRRNIVTCSHKRELVQFGDEIDFTSLFAVQIPSGATEVVGHAFEDCRTLASVIIPDSVTKICQFAFDGCTSLETVPIPDSVSAIDFRAFAGCTSLTSVTIPDSVTHIEGEAFFGCHALTVLLSNSRTWTGCETFSFCKRVRVLAKESKDTGCKRIQAVLAKECECQECEYCWFLNGWVCPKRR